MTAITSAYAHAYQVTCLTRHVLQSRVWTAASGVPKPDTRISPTFVPQDPREAMTSNDGPYILKGVLAMSMVKPWLDGVLSLDLFVEE